jgi:hypothetical protein
MIWLNDWITHQVEKILYHTHSSREIKSFILRRYGSVEKNLTFLDEKAKAEIAHDLWQIYEIMLVLGWVKLHAKSQNPFNAYCSKKKVLLSELMAWKKDLWDGKVIHTGIVKTGTGFYLDQAALDEIVFHDSFVTDNLEIILKHIETRREKSFQDFDTVADGEILWFERLNIVILLARAARRKKDPRFLNAVLKLNDLYFPKLQRKSTQPQMVRFLLALAEQEYTFKELYP